MEEREIVIVGTKGATQEDSDCYPVLTKDEVIQRIPELLDEDVGYTIIIATKEVDKE